METKLSAQQKKLLRTILVVATSHAARGQVTEINVNRRGLGGGDESHRASISRTLARLEKRGILIIYRNQSTGQGETIELTASGARIAISQLSNRASDNFVRRRLHPTLLAVAENG